MGATGISAISKAFYMLRGIGLFISGRAVLTIPRISYVHSGLTSSARSRNSSYRKAITATIVAVVIGVFGVGGQECRSAYQKSAKTAAITPIEFETLCRQTRQLVKELKYTDEVAGDFVRMVEGWKDKRGNSVLVGWRQTLDQVRENCKQNADPKGRLATVAQIEESITRELARRIRKEVGFGGDFFDLGDVTKHRQAQCLGYTQLLYVLGNSIGLSVESVNVMELKTGALPIGSAHTANTVNLTGGKMMMADLAEGGFISMPFVIGEEFVKAGEHWELKDEDSFLGVDRKIQILDHSGLVAYIYNERAAMHNKQGRHTEALVCLNKAIEHHPGYADAYLNRGITYRNLGQLGEAASNYDRAIELRSDFAEAYYDRGILYSKLEQFERTITDCSKAIELRPNFAQAYYSRGNAYRQLGRLDQAVSDYSTAIKFNSSFANAYGSRGLVYAVLGESEKAKRDLLKMVKLNPALRPQIEAISNRFALDIDIDSLSTMSIN